MVIAKHFFGMKSGDVSLEVVLHLGSLLAVLLYFRRDLLRLCKNFLRFGDASQEVLLARKEVIFLLAIAKKPMPRRAFGRFAKKDRVINP